MHSVHNNNISNLYFGFSKVEKFHHYCTRTSTKSNFVQTSARTEKGKSTISFTGPKIWREIPSDMKNLSNNSFKYQYKRRLLMLYWIISDGKLIWLVISIWSSVLLCYLSIIIIIIFCYLFIYFLLVCLWFFCFCSHFFLWFFC